MSRYITRPDNALKRAKEFIAVDKPARALDTLQEVFRTKKWTYNWSESVIEPIMFQYLELCVDLKKSHIAKEGLFQYRNIFQQVNVGSLENVIRGYLKMAEDRAEAAQQQSSQAILDIDDLDNLATPESILMSAVCGEDAQDRSDRTILLPWVKFLWESYCQCLELLRVNTHCETLYHDIARMAFQFCLKYNRKMEFRKLCEKLRKHLEDICKVSSQTASVSISRPETQQLNLDTRLHQLDNAIQMELWQEAYKAIEDIHGLMTMSKKVPVPKTMAQYYQKLAMVFWKAGNQLFHAAALLKLFQLSRDMKKNVTADELQRMASHVLIATLAIPLPSAHPEFDRFIETDKSPLEKAQRLAVLLGLTQPPSRASLIKDVIRLNVLQLAAPEFQNLYKWLEIDFDPLNLCKHVGSVTDGITNDENNPYVQYVQALQDVTLFRLVRQICQVYQSIEFSRFLELAKFATSFSLERILVECVRHNDMQITIDHRSRCVHFGQDLSESQREDHLDGPCLQSMPSEQVRSQLVNMSIVLHRAIAAIKPNRMKAERDQMRAQMVRNYHENAAKEHQRILQRQKIIEDRKEYIERVNYEREEEEQRLREEVQRQQKEQEQLRLAQENEEREKKRKQNEIQQIKERNLKEKVQQISQTSHGQKVLKSLDEEEIKKMDAEQIAAREADELLKERKEMQSKLKSQEKKIDYYERAKRMEEIPLIDKYLSEKMVQDKEFWEHQEKTRIEQAVAERKNAVAQQDRLKRMVPDYEKFFEELRAERNSLYLDKLKQFNVALEEERRKRLVERVNQRRKERRQKWLQEKEEESKRKEDEERKKREEIERIERERKAEERRQEMEKARIQMEKQRQKEEEIERKLAEEKEALQKERKEWGRREERPIERGPPRSQPADNAPAPTADAAAAQTGGSGGASSWRSHEQGEGKKDVWQPRYRERAGGADDHEKRGDGGRLRDGQDRRPGGYGRRDDRGPRDRDDRGPRDRDDRGPRDRDDRGPRDRDDRGPRDRDDRGPRGRDDRGPRGGDREERGPRGGDREERGGGSWRREDRKEGGGGGRDNTNWRTGPRPDQQQPLRQRNDDRREREPAQRKEEAPKEEAADDGWTNVRHHR